jgi:hypothetical protein
MAPTTCEALRYEIGERAPTSPTAVTGEDVDGGGPLPQGGPVEVGRPGSLLFGGHRRFGAGGRGGLHLRSRAHLSAQPGGWPEDAVEVKDG